MTTADEEDLTQVFRQEANAIIDGVTESLLRLERGHQPEDARVESLRHFHTLKGMANMEGHPELAAMCHESEAILLRDAAPAIDALLRRVDGMRRWLEEHGLGRQGDVGAGAAYVSVETERLDRLLNLAGELTVTSTRLAYEDRAGTSSADTLRTLGGLVRSLQDEVMRTRLLPARALFAGLPRLVRDASKARGLDVALVLDEGNIGLDRSLVDRLSGLLAHLVQNSIAHGIEPPEERRESGKPAQGTIHVRLRREQETIAVEIEDDGRGLDEAAIRAQAVELGIWTPAQAAQAGRAEISDLIFAPNFSTQTTADSTAGRGIGLTAVRETVRELGGTLRVDSRLGAGTLVTLHLPPTVAMLETLVATANGATVALPLRYIRRIRSVADTVDIGGRRFLIEEGRAIPLLAIRGAPATKDEGRFAVVLEATRGRFALAVDEMLGAHSTILKPLDPHVLERQEHAMGAAVLGSGTLAIVVDPNHYAGRA